MAQITPPDIQEGVQQPATNAERPEERVNHWVVPLTLVIALLYLLAVSTMEMLPRVSDAPSGDTAAVTFGDGTTYEHALDDVTSLGLRLSNPCVELMIRYGVNYFSLSDPNVASGEAYFDTSSDLIVATTAITLNDWVARLAALPGSPQVTQPVTVSCPRIPASPDFAGLMQEALPLARPATLHFISSMTYGDALRVAAERGLRLADPCYEAAVASGKHPAWHSESQQKAFTSSSTLVVAPTILTPRDWLLNLPSDVTAGPVLVICLGT